MTIYIQVHEGQHPDHLPPDLWHPWIHCKDMEETIRLALHRHIMNRGGVRERVTVRVYAALGEEINGGHPKSAFCTVFNVWPR